MKRSLLLFLIISVMLMLISCGGEKETSDADGTTATDTTAKESDTDTDTAGEDIDFSAMTLSGYKVISVGEEFDGDGYVSDSTVISSGNGKVTGKKKGFSLLSEDGVSAVAVCVLPEGMAEDKSAGTPVFVKVGEELSLTADIPNPSFFSSDSEVIEVNGNTGYCKGAGYCVITASNASVPRFFAYIVIDK